MMSDMKTFTARDLSRSTAAVLAASEVDGVAKINTRDGRVFELRPVVSNASEDTNVSNAVAKHLKWKQRMRMRFPAAIPACVFDEVTHALSEDRGV